MTYTSTAIETQGFKLEIGAGTSPVFVEVKEIKQFQGLDGEANTIDITHLQSAAKEKLMGLQDWGSWNVDTNYLPDDTGQIAARAAKASRLKQSFRATLSDGTIITFQGFVKNSPISGGVDAVVEGSFSIEITGDVTFA